MSRLAAMLLSPVVVLAGLLCPPAARGEERAVPEAEAPVVDARRPPIIEAIDVVGNDKTEREVIMQRVSVQSGDPVDDNRIEASRLRLLALGYFKSVELSLRRGSRRGLVVLVIEVIERNTIVIDGLYLGRSSVTPFFGGIGVHESNLLGKGVGAGAGFVLGEGRRAVEASLFIPDLSGTPLQLSASGIYVDAAEVLVVSDPDALQLRYSRVGASLGLGLGVGLAQRVSLSYRLESISVAPLPNLDPASLRAAPSILFDSSVLSTLSLTYELDTRDDAFVPTRGTRVGLAVETGTRLIGSSYEFTKYTGEVQLAFQPIRGHSLTLQVAGGLIQGQTPFFNQFFLRDYQYFTVGRDTLPRALQTNMSRSNDYDDLIASAGVEYNLPIQSGDGFLFRTYLYGGVNVAATASLDEVQEDLSGRGTGRKLPLSADLGLRMDTLIGNFTVSIAYLLDQGI